MNLASYHSPLVERREGGIEGLGLFVVEDVQPGQLLAVKGGRLVTEQEIIINKDVVNGSHHQVAPDLFLAGLTPEEVDKTLIGYNHSCEPNAYVDGQIAVRAMQHIPKGKEATVDYATVFSSDTQLFECKCGSAECRHIIRPTIDSTNPELKRKYQGYLADFLANPNAYADVQLAPIDPNCPVTSYITAKIERVEAKIHGLGLATLEPVRQGELLAVRGGRLVTKDEVLAHQDVLKGGEVQITDGLFLASSNEQERLATMMGFNHSCEPNSYLGRHIGLFAMKDIPEGTELTIDYAAAYDSPSQRFECKCGTASCRHFIDTTIDWQDPDIQTRNEGHFADFIQRKIISGPN